MCVVKKRGKGGEFKIKTVHEELKIYILNFDKEL